MKSFELKNNLKLIICNKKDYIKNNEKINAACLKIISSHEKNCAKECATSQELLYDLNSNLFLDDSEALICLLETSTKPKFASFVIFTTDKQNPHVWHTEIMYTHKNKINCGYATYLLENCIDYLVESKKAKLLTFSVEKSNKESIGFHNKVILNNKLPSNCTKENGVYHYSLVLDKQQIKSSNDACKLLN